MNISKLSFTIVILTICTNFFSVNNLQAQECEDSQNIMAACSGISFDLCIDRVGTIENVPLDINITSNDEFAIFNPCDITLPTNTNEGGTITKNEDCSLTYTPATDFVGLDQFDYSFCYRDICYNGDDYCTGADGSALGKIWTMDVVYFGTESDIIITVSNKNQPPFATVSGINPGEQFYVDGTGLPSNNSNWKFRLYADQTNLTNDTPFEITEIHTSCSVPIFGVNFGSLRPVSGCVAPTGSRTDCSPNNPNPGGSQIIASSVICDVTTVFILVIDSGTLPIEFTQITGRAVNKNNLIQWGISSVINEERMILQKSSNGIDFEDIKGYTELKAGDFDFLDNNVTSRISYYRFKIVSNEGKITLSRFIPVTNESFEKGNVDVYPNPTKDEINFNSDIKISKIEVYDIAGRKQLSTVVDNNNIKLNASVSGLTSGLYFTNIYLENGQIISKKINILN